MKNSLYKRCEKYICFLPKIIIIIIAIILFSRLILYNSSIFYRKTLTAPLSLHLNKQDVVLIKGEAFHLSVFGLNKRVSFYSTNFTVAGVNFLGKVYAYRTGKAFIIAKVDGKRLKCRVRVIDINRTSLRLKPGGSYRLRINGPGGYVSWKSSNIRVASVSFFGKVSVKGRGTAAITARVRGRLLKCRVRVR